MKQVSSENSQEWQANSSEFQNDEQRCQKVFDELHKVRISQKQYSVFSKYNLGSCVGRQCADEVQQYLQDFLWPLGGWKDAETVSAAKQCGCKHHTVTCVKRKIY